MWPRWRTLMLKTSSLCKWNNYCLWLMWVSAPPQRSPNTLTVLLELLQDISGLTLTIAECICSAIFWSSDHKKEHFSRGTRSERPSWCAHSIWLDILSQILWNYNAPIQLAIHLNGYKLYGSLDVTKTRLFTFCPGDHLQVNTLVYGHIFILRCYTVFLVKVWAMKCCSSSNFTFVFSERK